MSSSLSKKTAYLLIALTGIALDQLTKWEILAHFQEGERLNIIPSLFDLTLAYNPGAAFSFLADQGGWQKFFFLGLALVISAYLARAILRDEFRLSGNIGGALGNVIDRLIHGHVVDFLLFYWNDWYYPAFNVADSFICVGAVLLVLDGLFHKKQPKPTDEPTTDNP